MDRVNVAHQHVRAEGNILRRALPAAEYADILHFEVCWLDGMAGDRVVPFLHLLGRGNVYLAITTTNVHFVAMRGIDPTVATLPLSQIDGVEAKGPVPARFFHSHIHGEPDAMRVAKRFEIRARRRRPWQDGPAPPRRPRGAARLESNAAAAKKPRALPGRSPRATKPPGRRRVSRSSAPRRTSARPSPVRGLERHGGSLGDATGDARHGNAP